LISDVRCVLVPLIVVLSSGCGGDTPSQPTATVETLELRLQTAHFRILAAATTPGSLVQGVADHLEGDYDRILIELRVAAHPITTVRIWRDETTYFNELTRHFGVRYQANGYITGPSELRLLATSNVNVNAVHEFVHAVSLTLNPRFANNPRWLWEAVALYWNNEFVDPRTLDYVVRGNFPTLQQLNVDPNAGTQIYQLGYVLGEFIVAQYGRTTLIRLIENNGNLGTLLTVSDAAFEAAWQSYVRQRYLS
jgi:hypothetical protein